MAVLEGRGLSRTYRLGATLVPAVTDVDVAVSRGEFLVLQGPSGSGKTTLINLLGLLDRPDGGEIRLDGGRVTELNEDQLADVRRDRFGFVFQTFSLVPVLTAAENVEYPMTLKGRSGDDCRRRSADLLSQVGLSGKRDVRPDLLSGGERQRVAIARAMANEPDVVLADEPTANLDSRAATDVLGLMRRLTEERQVSFVVATHDPRVMAAADRAVVLCDGRVVDGA